MKVSSKQSNTKSITLRVFCCCCCFKLQFTLFFVQIHSLGELNGRQLSISKPVVLKQHNSAAQGTFDDIKTLLVVTRMKCVTTVI